MNFFCFSGLKFKFGWEGPRRKCWCRATWATKQNKLVCYCNLTIQLLLPGGSAVYYNFRKRKKNKKNRAGWFLTFWDIYLSIMLWSALTFLTWSKIKPELSPTRFLVFKVVYYYSSNFWVLHSYIWHLMSCFKKFLKIKPMTLFCLQLLIVRFYALSLCLGWKI